MATPRIPQDLYLGGFHVACRNPRPGQLAHQPATVRREIPGRTVNGQPAYEHLTTAACQPNGDTVPLVTAHWADHMGATACTAGACFPDAA